MNRNLDENMSNCEGSVCSGSRNDNGCIFPPPVKKKRTQPGHPEPGAEVIALSPRTLLATNRFVCEVCKKGFQRDQNLQLHRRGHNLPWKLKQKTTKQVTKKVYICPETTCVHHDPTRALGDLTGIKKHFYRKHGEKKWKCDKCSKKYAVQSDWKAHSKICGTREYRCDCGTIFSRRDSFITHKAFCDALAQENTRNSGISLQNGANRSLESEYNSSQNTQFPIKKEQQNFLPPWITCPPTMGPTPLDPTPPFIFQDFNQNQDFNHQNQAPNPNPISSMGPTALSPFHHPLPPPEISATALLQKASQMGSKSSTTLPSPTGMFIRPHQPHVPGFGPSRDAFAHGLASFGNKAAAVAGGGTDSGGATAGGNSDALMHEMMMDSSAGFDDIGFGEMVRKGQYQGLHAAMGQFSGAREGDSLTRDFLGLRALSQSDILSFSTALDSYINSASCDENQNLAGKSWQD